MPRVLAAFIGFWPTVRVSRRGGPEDRCRRRNPQLPRSDRQSQSFKQRSYRRFGRVLAALTGPLYAVRGATCRERTRRTCVYSAGRRGHGGAGTCGLACLCPPCRTALGRMAISILHTVGQETVVGGQNWLLLFNLRIRKIVLELSV